MKSHGHCCSPLKVSGALFALIALFYIVSLIMNWPMTLNGMPVGIWPSIVIAAIGVLMAIWNFKCCHCCCKKCHGKSCEHEQPPTNP